MDFDEGGRPNKSALKRAAKEVEAVAVQLAGAAPSALSGLELSAELREELGLVARAKGHGARDRQIRHLAGALRQRPEELAIIRAHLARESDRHWEQQRLFHQLEQWRDRLCAPTEAEAALKELAELRPELDLKDLGKLSRTACNGDKAAARLIFRRLREAWEGSGEG